MAATSNQLSVVHVLAPAPFGGLESVVATLAAGQVAAGESVCVAAVVAQDGASGHPFVDELRRRGIEVEVLALGGRAYLEERRVVGALLRRRGAHILHTHGYRPDVVDAPVARRAGIGTVATVHGYTGGGGIKGRLYEWLQTRAYRRFDAVLAVSAKLRCELVAAGVAEARVHAIPNAWSSSVPMLSRDDARRALGIPSGARVVGWVGRLSQEKAPDVALQVLAAMRSDATLSVIGTGPLDERLTSLSRELNVADRVRRHGHVANAGSHLRAFDALLITSWTEGTPITLLEAMAAEVPIVTTAVGGIPDVVGTEEARLAEAGGVDALARALDETLADARSAAARAANARRRLETAFAVGPWVEQHGRVYRSVLSARGTPRPR